MAEVPRNEIRLVTIGKTGNGKSSSCNTILGQDICESGCGNAGVTTSCMVRYAKRFEKLICLVDTPGIQDSSRNNEDVQNEIRDCIKFSCPGPHAIILVVPIGRFTDEDVKTVEHFCSHFGKELEKYVIVLFTRFDDMKREMKKNPNHLGMKGFIEKLTPRLKEFLSKCEYRYVEFDNTLEGISAESQVQRLLDVVDNMVRENGGLHYTNKDYQDAEIELQRQIAEIKQKNELERMKIEEKMRKEISDDIRKQYEQKQQELLRELERMREKAKRGNWFTKLIGL
ncbi:Hypothetical predicted protein [Mytilus galloprovincialis]|uniref:AIG1-type G domain-containing protein n=1 Tax=Mytilus galloprovincialis TaxID=29158 RepID=A0A8B6C3D0_MYTGA|nr:Hypothetical predicted protein [Mytilus galloprovincialis]